MPAMTREYDHRGFRVLNDPPRTCLKLDEDRELQALGHGEEIEAMLLAEKEARE